MPFFSYFCIKIALVTSQEYLRPPPQTKVLERNEQYIYYICMNIFRRVFVEFAVLLTKVCPKNIDL